MQYLICLGAGVLVGIIYSLINVRSPARPWSRWWVSSACLPASRPSLWASGSWRARLSQSPGGKRNAQRICLACCRAAMPMRPQRFPRPISRRTAHDRCSRSHCDQCSCDHSRPRLIVGRKSGSAFRHLRHRRAVGGIRAPCYSARRRLASRVISLSTGTCS
jgi:Protein of unknown function (DUF1427)